MKVNGKRSAGNRIWALDIRYFLLQIKLKKKMYRLNIVQHIICGEISQQRQCREKSLGTLETTYLVEMNEV